MGKYTCCRPQILKIVPKAECYLFTGAVDLYKKLKPRYADYVTMTKKKERKNTKKVFSVLSNVN